MHPLLLSQMPWPTAVVSPPAPTTATGATCGTKIRLRVESAATECEPELCGIFSIRTLVLSTTPSTAVCPTDVALGAAVGQGVGGFDPTAYDVQFLLAPK